MYRQVALNFAKITINLSASAYCFLTAERRHGMILHHFGSNINTGSAFLVVSCTSGAFKYTGVYAPSQWGLHSTKINLI
jgi:hypothetical protein